LFCFLIFFHVIFFPLLLYCLRKIPKISKSWGGALRCYMCYQLSLFYISYSIFYSYVILVIPFTCHKYNIWNITSQPLINISNVVSHLLFSSS
jgi:hypothetical protein